MKAILLSVYHFHTFSSSCKGCNLQTNVHICLPKYIKKAFFHLSLLKNTKTKSIFSEINFPHPKYHFYFLPLPHKN